MDVAGWLISTLTCFIDSKFYTFVCDVIYASFFLPHLTFSLHKLDGYRHMLSDLIVIAPKSPVLMNGCGNTFRGISHIWLLFLNVTLSCEKSLEDGQTDYMYLNRPSKTALNRMQLEFDSCYIMLFFYTILKVGVHLWLS